MKVKQLIEELKKLNPEGFITFFEYESDQFYRISELPVEAGGGIYIIAIQKTKKKSNIY